MADPVKLIECPRDAWQGLKGLIPADLKVDYLKALISAGFKHIDAVSFVSPKAVPQMADSEEVLKELDPPDDVEIIGIVVNEKGAERAIETKAVSTLGFPYSISETFLRKNQNQSPEEALEELEKIQNKADDARLDVVVYISMAFGNPYGDLWNPDEVIEAISLMEVDNLRMISLADTVGMASPQQISDVVGAVMAKYDYLEIGVHLHSRPDQAAEKILAAYDAGCRRFDSALGGLGGCPFAQDALVGNIPTEKVIEALTQRGAAVASAETVGFSAESDGGNRGKVFQFAGGGLIHAMDYKTIQLAYDGGVATLTLNRPEKRNAISFELIDDLLHALDEVAKSDAIVLIVTGAGKAFCSGLDLDNLKSLLGRSPEQNLQDSQTMVQLFRSLYEFPKVTIAAVNGAAIAGGTGLALLCDFTLAVPDAKFGYTEVRIGFVPAIVSTFLLRQVGEKQARDLLLTGRIFGAEEAARMGLVSEIVPAENLMARARELAALLMENSSASLRATKQLLTDHARAELDLQIDAAVRENAAIRTTADFREGISSFLEKRKPVWTGK